MKLTSDTYSCNSLTNFEHEVPEISENGSYANLLKLAQNTNREITSSKLVFGGF